MQSIDKVPRYTIEAVVYKLNIRKADNTSFSDLRTKDNKGAYTFCRHGEVMLRLGG